MRKILFLSLSCFLFLQQVPVFAEETSLAELAETVKQLQQTVARQDAEIAQLKQRLGEPAASMPPQGAPSIPNSTQGAELGGRSLRARWNPDIGAVADIVAKLDSPREDAEGADRISVRELELAIGSAVDPYSRFDLTVSLSDFEETGLEEAYYTHFELPLETTMRLGRFKPAIGKAIPLHRDSLDTVDEPLVIQRYFGLEGYNKTGIDFKKPLELPWSLAHELSVGVLEGGNGEAGTLFGDTRRHPTLYAHLKNYAEISEYTGLETGFSYLAGSRDDDSTFEVNVLGADATWIHLYGNRQQWKLQGESFLVNRTESFYEFTDPATGILTHEDLDDARHLWGSYALADWRFHAQWAAGFRFDHVQRVNDVVSNPDSADTGYTGYLTFYQSEFARWRAQFSHFDLVDGNDDNQILLQGTFAVGEHKHKIQ